jgi:hypothetical protein
VLAACGARRVAAPVTDPLLLHLEGVGEIRLGAPLPVAFAGAVDGGYFARWASDGQPWEGVHLQDPPIQVGLAGGPWTKEALRSGEPPVMETLSVAARSWAPRAKVANIVVKDARVHSAGGVGVGSTLFAIEAAHGKASVLPVPQTLGEDECNVQVAALPGVSFVFTTCAAAKEGAAASRVDLWGKGLPAR